MPSQEAKGGGLPTLPYTDRALRICASRHWTALHGLVPGGREPTSHSIALLASGAMQHNAGQAAPQKAVCSARQVSLEHHVTWRLTDHISLPCGAGSPGSCAGGCSGRGARGAPLSHLAPLTEAAGTVFSPSLYWWLNFAALPVILSVLPGGARRCARGSPRSCRSRF